MSEMTPEIRTFPMQDGPDIPWPLAERIYSVYADLFGQSQSLETLAKRGGFGWAEIPIFRKEYCAKHGRWPDWGATVSALREADDTAAQERP